MSRTAFLVVPGRLDSLTGGYIYDRRITEELGRHGWQLEVREIDEGFPFPTAAVLERAGKTLGAIPDGSVVVVDGLAFGAMPDLVEREASRLRFAPIVHLPLAADIGLDRETSARLEASEKRALACARLVIVTGRSTLTLLESYGLAPEKVVVIEPGTDRHALPVVEAGVSRRVELLCVATLNPGKGHDILLRALARLRDRAWHLTCAGSLTRHPETVVRVRALLRELDLEDRVDLAGELSEKGLEAAYGRTDLFVLATLQETYGMAAAEALGHGLPIVATSTGALPELVGRDAGVLVAPGDVAALAAALARVMDDGELRSRLADGARRAAER